MTKNTKSTKKTNKKTVKPTFIVDVTECNSPEEIRRAFTLAKVKNGVAITFDELDHFVSTIVEDYNDVVTSTIAAAFICSNCCECEKKQPWYKRFWKWLRRK